MLVLLRSTEDSSSGVGFLLFCLMASLGHWVMMAVETCMSRRPPPPVFEKHRFLASTQGGSLLITGLRPAVSALC